MRVSKFRRLPNADMSVRPPLVSISSDQNRSDCTLTGNQNQSPTTSCWHSWFKPWTNIESGLRHRWKHPAVYRRPASPTSPDSSLCPALFNIVNNHRCRAWVRNRSQHCQITFHPVSYHHHNQRAWSLPRYARRSKGTLLQVSPCKWIHVSLNFLEHCWLCCNSIQQVLSNSPPHIYNSRSWKYVLELC